MLSEMQLRQVWAPLQEYFEATISKLKNEFPDIFPSAIWTHNSNFPFTGYLSLLATHDLNRVEDCVLMMEVRVVHDRMLVKYDISSGHGDLFAYGPDLVFPAVAADEEQLAFLLEMEKAAEEFFTDNLDDVRRALMSAEQ